MTSPQPYEPVEQPPAAPSPAASPSAGPPPAAPPFAGPPPAAPPPPEVGQPHYPPYPQPYPQGYPQFYPQPWPAPYLGTNGFAIAGFVCSFFSVLGGILGIVFGSIALNQIRATGQRGKGLATAGLVIGSCWILFVLIAIISSAARQ